MVAKQISVFVREKKFAYISAPGHQIIEILVSTPHNYGAEI
jgi:hypothetical protein